MAQVIIDNLYKTYTPSSKKFSPSFALGVTGVTNSPDTVENSPTSTHVLKGINLTIEDGEFMVLVGASGCGKSTLLRLIAGLEDISAGNITIGDRTVNNLPPKARDIAMVFQNYALYPHLTVYDNIAFGLRRMNQGIPSTPVDKILTTLTAKLPKKWRYLSKSEKEISKKVHLVAQMLQIEHLLQRLPKQLSGGQKQRVALGRAISRNPLVFLMDEPLSNLDAKLRTETRGQIVKLQKQLGVTTIYVTHDQTEAMTMGDRIAIMNQGEIQQVSTPLEIYHQPINKFVAQFIGSPPMNFLEVNYEKPDLITHSHFKLSLSSKWQQLLKNYNYEKIWLGIRPEYFTISSELDNSISVIVNLVEALGNESILNVHLQGDTQYNLLVKIFTDQIIKIGDKLNLQINLEKVNFFDYYNQKNIHYIEND
ncbi:ABC transporter ATP-binding protein [Geminocystis sp. CENA526]|uniref:ABC transporter ATP-binding protein n=1 Tax=Geminocystis sp. CENA526 TaxID=1355871 RepID=UPI003D6F0C52